MNLSYYNKFTDYYLQITSNYYTSNWYKLLVIVSLTALKLYKCQ